MSGVESPKKQAKTGNFIKNLCLRYDSANLHQWVRLDDAEKQIADLKDDVAGLFDESVRQKKRAILAEGRLEVIQKCIPTLRRRFTKRFLLADRYYEKNELQTILKELLDEQEEELAVLLKEGETITKCYNTKCWNQNPKTNECRQYYTRIDECDGYKGDPPLEKKVGEECPTDCKQFPNEKTCWANPICKKKVGEEQ